MQSRQKTKQEILLEKILCLYPDAKFTVRPYDNNENLALNPVVYEDLLIDWHPDNGAIPDFSEIENTVTDVQVQEKQEADRKKYRNEEANKNLNLKASFRIERTARPELTFEQYLDELEEVIF